MLISTFKLAAALAICLLTEVGCATLPDTDDLIARHAGQTVKFENANGPVSAARNAALLAELKRKSPNLDILEKHVALEQAIVGSPLVLGNKITLLQDGAATYPAMFAAIRKATDHINLETYIIEDDELGRQFSELLLERQAQGIQVNMIFDSVGGLSTPKAFFDRLSEGGIAVLEFNPLNPLKAQAPWLINNRDHRKLLIIDGKVAFLGGINISSVYSSGSISLRKPENANNALAWRDTDLEIEGPVVAELQKLFMQTWEKQHGQPLAAKDYFPQLVTRGPEMVRAIGSTPDDPFSLIYLTLISAIDHSEKQVFMTNAYFVPPPRSC